MSPLVLLAIVAAVAGADPETESESETTRASVAAPVPVPAPVPASPRRYETVVRSTPSRAPAVETVATDEARRAAGTGGDPAKILESLPGVARAAYGAGQLIVWGAAPSDSRVYVDDVEVKHLYHLGGFRSTVNEGLVRTLSLAPGAYDAAFGRALGGLIRVETRELPLADRRVHGYVAVDVLDASLFVAAPLGPRLDVAIAGRYGYLDRLARAVLSPKQRDVVAAPSYDDYQLKATVRLRPHESLTILFLGSDDRLRHALDSADPTAVRSEETIAQSYRGIVTYRLASEGDAEAEVKVTPYAGFDRERLHASLGNVASTLDIATVRFGLRASYRRRLFRRLALELGVDLAGARADVSRLGSASVPAREGEPFVFGQPPGDDVALDRYRILQVDAAPYLNAVLRVGTLALTAGLRIVASYTEGNRAALPSGDLPVAGFSSLRWTAEPRLQLAWRAHARVTLSAATGLLHQAPRVEDLGPRFGTPTLGLERAVQTTAGVTVHATPSLRIEVNAWFTYLDQLVTRSADPSPPIAHALVNDGTGRAYGAAFVARLAVWRGLSGWLTYTVSRSERRDHPTSAWRLSDYDQTHVLQLVASYEVRGWGIGARLRWASGFPRTPVVGAYFDARGDRDEPRFGDVNTIRLPDFVALDLRIEKTLAWAAVALTLYLDVQNVTARKNPEEIVYSEDFRRRGYLMGLPTLAIAGAKVLF